MATLTCMHTRRTSQHGFSLLEVLITIGVLAVGLVAMARFQATVLQGSSLARERSEAVALAEQKIEQLRNYRDVANSSVALDYDDIAASCATAGTTETAVYSNSGNSGNTVYLRTCTSAEPDISGAYSYTKITVRVTWLRPGGTVVDPEAATNTCLTATLATADTCVTLSSIITNANPRYSGRLS